MKSLCVFFLILIFLTCNLAQEQGVGCVPKCTCGQVAGKFGPRYSIITCEEIPTTRLPSDATHLKVLKSPITLKSNSFTPLIATHVKNLDLCQSGVTEISEKAFSPFIQANVIKLSSNQISTISATAFLGLPYLEEIYLDRNRLMEIKENCFSAIPKLQKLFLQWNQLDSVPKMPPTLVMLDLSHNNVSHIKNFQIQKSTKYVDLCDNKLTDIPAESFASAKNLLSICVPGEAAFNAPVSSMKKLQNITIEAQYPNAPLSSQMIEHIKSLSSIQHLTIGGFKIEDFEFMKNKNYKSLRLINVVLPNPAVRKNWLNIVKDMNNLETLDLSGTSELGKEILSSNVTEQLTNLKELILRNASIQNLGNLKVLNHHTMEVDISYNPLICDCAMKNKFIDYNIEVRKEEETLCSQPEIYRGHLLPEVIPQLFCEENDPTTVMLPTEKPFLEEENKKHVDIYHIRGDDDTEEIDDAEEGVRGKIDDLKENDFGPDESTTEIENPSVDKFIHTHSPEEYEYSNEHDYDVLESEAHEKTQKVKEIVTGVVIGVLLLVLIIVASLYIYFRHRGHMHMRTDTAKEATSKDNLIQYSKK